MKSEALKEAQKTYRASHKEQNRRISYKATAKMYIKMATPEELASLKKEIEKMEVIKVTNLSGSEIIWESAFELMDDGLANEISLKLSPCTEQELMAAYEAAHAEKFGETWELSKINPEY